MRWGRCREIHPAAYLQGVAPLAGLGTGGGQVPVECPWQLPENPTVRQNREAGRRAVWARVVRRCDFENDDARAFVNGTRFRILAVVGDFDEALFGSLAHARAVLAAWRPTAPLSPPLRASKWGASQFQLAFRGFNQNRLAGSSL